jgi:hypothetical protein
MDDNKKKKGREDNPGNKQTTEQDKSTHEREGGQRDETKTEDML